MVRNGDAPAWRIALAGVVALAVMAGVLWAATQLPWLGLRMQWDGQGARVVSASGPAATIPPGTRIVRIEDVTLRGEDFTEEPDSSLLTYSAYAEFLSRQQTLFERMSSVRLRLHSPDAVFELEPGASRPLSSLPHEFWIQLAVGFFALLISAGVWAFRAHEPSARYLLLSGFATLIFAPFAGVYSTRELALPGELFRWLSDANFCGGCIYVGTMVAMLWHYPRPLGSARVSASVVGALVLWFFAQELGAFESMVVARRYPVFAALLGTFALSAVQYRVTRGDPVARASLSWFLLSWLLGSSLFAMITMVPQLFGVNTAALQGYGFLLFLLVYGGLAFGILRFRLFELGQWWFRTFAWILGALLLFAVDLAVAAWFALPQGQSLALALLVCGFLYLPLRGLLWTRLIAARRVEQPDLFKRVIQIAFAPTAEASTQGWHALCRELFDPLHVQPYAGAYEQVSLDSDGLRLSVPAIGSIDGLALSYAARGRRLFAPRDRELLQQAVDMLRYVDESRAAYSRGASAERTRIARDLHDDLGSRLLTGLHQPRLEQTKASITLALAEMRTIIRGLSGDKLKLDSLLAELRHETRARLDAAGILLEWPLDEPGMGDAELSYAAYKHYLSIMRELVSNVVRHAGASTVKVAVHLDGMHLISEVTDDGVGFAADANEGHGMPNLRQRLRELGGSIGYRRKPRGTEVRVRIALEG
ncbi:MAG: ATP-binding protein [Polyangiales bacterium]